MSTYIIEYIGASGLRHSKGYEASNRLCNPRSGDIIDFENFEGTYPFTHGRYGRIEEVGTGYCEKDEVHLCCELGSAFLNDSGSVSISGGPFCVVKLDDLEPTLRTYPATYWNWGNNGSGGGHGVNYIIARPVFRLINYRDKR